VNFIVVLEPSRQQSDYGLSIHECLRDAVGFRRADWRETKLEAQGRCGVERVRGAVGRGGDEKNHDEDVGVRLPRCARGARSYHLLIIDRASSSARSRGPVTTLLAPSKPPG
jgi:hypothetical protein